VTWFAAPDATSLAKIEAVNWVAEAKVVVLGVPFQLTVGVLPLTNPFPFTVRVKAVPGAFVENGEIEVSPNTA
jgi:hypothetical protein